MKIALKNTPILVSPMTSKPAETPDELMISLRSIRSWMLSGSDWTQLPDCPLSSESKEQWRVWRQSLRDITETVNVGNVGDWFEIPDFPSDGLPSTWLDWEYETFNRIIDEFNEMVNHGDF